MIGPGGIHITYPAFDRLPHLAGGSFFIDAALFLSQAHAAKPQDR